MPEFLFLSTLFEEVIRLLRMKPRILAFDFDGTLAPIAESPAGAVIPENLLYLLEKLAADKYTAVAIVSGRTVQDLERIIRIPAIIYFGNHGITSSIEGLGAGRLELIKWSVEAAEVYEKILYLESNFEGCIIENKGPVISVHYRGVDVAESGELLEEVRGIAAEFDVELAEGKKVIELKPKTNLTKGTALKEITLKGFPAWSKDDPFLFAGDDKTDEDGFRILKSFGKRSFGFKIGAGETSADYRLVDREIVKLIEIIL